MGRLERLEKHMSSLRFTSSAAFGGGLDLGQAASCLCSMPWYSEIYQSG